MGQAMTNIINFPKPGLSPIKVELNPQKPGIVSVVIKGVWVFTVLFWPFIRFLLSIDCAFQFFRMIYLWNTFGMYAAWTFIIHFAVLTLLTCFVSIYKPNTE